MASYDTCASESGDAGICQPLSGETLVQVRAGMDAWTA